jgi:hypothetical protein
MPLKYEIIPDLGLVYVRYWGICTVQETIETFARYAAEPEAAPDQRHLVDLSRVEEYERHFPELMKLQAQKADAVTKGATPATLLYYAPTPISLSMARTILRSWDGLDQVVGRIADTEAQALDMLGLRQRRFADLPLTLA